MSSAFSVGAQVAVRDLRQLGRVVGHEPAGSTNDWMAQHIIILANGQQIRRPVMDSEVYLAPAAYLLYAVRAPVERPLPLEGHSRWVHSFAEALAVINLPVNARVLEWCLIDMATGDAQRLSYVPDLDPRQIS